MPTSGVRWLKLRQNVKMNAIHEAFVRVQRRPLHLIYRALEMNRGLECVGRAKSGSYSLQAMTALRRAPSAHRPEIERPGRARSGCCPRVRNRPKKMGSPHWTTSATGWNPIKRGNRSA